MQKDHLSLQGEGDPSATTNEVILPYSTQDEGCFVFISYCLMVLSHSKICEINMYLLLHFIFLNHSVGIHPTATQKSHEQHSNAIHVTS